jgi:hypothetical protein
MECRGWPYSEMEGTRRRRMLVEDQSASSSKRHAMRVVHLGHESCRMPAMAQAPRIERGSGSVGETEHVDRNQAGWGGGGAQSNARLNAGSWRAREL